jgi:hypothetical protein
MTQPPTPYPPNPPAAQSWSSPAAPARRKPTGLIALVIGLAAILVGILGFTAGRLTAPVATTVRPSSMVPSASAKVSSTPTVASSTKKGFSLDGTTLTGWTSTGSAITTDLPTGWKIGNYNGGSNSGQILNASGDTIDYHSGYERAALDNCTTLMLTTKSDQDIVNLPGHTWAGKAATAVKINVHSDERNMTVVLTYVCVDTTTGHSDLVRLIATPQTNDAVMEAATSVLNAWKWS